MTIHLIYYYLDVTDQPQSIAPTLIAYRVANNASFTSHNPNLTPIAFATPSGPPKSTQIVSIGNDVRAQMISMSADMDGRHLSTLEQGDVGKNNA